MSGADYFRAAMFDLDGTLADTLADIASCGNSVLAHFGLPPLPVERYRYLAGQGARALVRDALGTTEDDPRLETGVRLFREQQLQHGLDHTVPYPGIPDLLDELARRGWKLAILSNKPHAATLEAVRRVLSRWTFDVVRGQRDGGPLKPDPTEALAIARELGIPPERWVYLGDTRVDMQTARAAGMRAVGVLWGFRTAEELTQAGAELLISHPLELLERLPHLARGP